MMRPLAEEFSQLLRRKPRSIRETIYKVRQMLLDKNRWVKEDFRFVRGYATRCSIVGALETVGGHFKQKAAQRIHKVIVRDFGAKRDVFSIRDFNNDRRTRHDDVVDVLNNAFELR